MWILLNLYLMSLFFNSFLGFVHSCLKNEIEDLGYKAAYCTELRYSGIAANLLALSFPLLNLVFTIKVGYNVAIMTFQLISIYNQPEKR